MVISDNLNKFKFLLICLLLFQLVGHLKSNPTSKKSHPITASIYSSSPSTNQNQFRESIEHSNENDEIYLESMEDLEHVTYLSLRNFNLTDENLEQSNPSYRRNEDLSENGDIRTVEDRGRRRLALMLESFIYHLRKDHLRRIELEELESLAKSMNLNIDAYGLSHSTQNESQSTSFDSEARSTQSVDRCYYLVEMYRQELKNREKNRDQIDSRIWIQEQISGSSINKYPNFNNLTANATTNPSISRIPETKRLLKLCRLVVDCQSAEDFQNIITGPWQDNQQQQNQEIGSSSNKGTGIVELPSKIEPRIIRIIRGIKASLRRNSELEIEGNPTSETYASSGGQRYGKGSSNTLRESLSRSLAKLCPLILFQLHDSEGHCTANRDDQPPMIAVWAFATLFVTIVSFCSLIGLSITPLLGSTATSGDDSSGLSSGIDSTSTSSSNSTNSDSINMQTRPTNGGHNEPNRACLTLFEGLAVGSLVGSALFSLIPQAFELQDRESNQGFLLKALIIFFGIYLFFCSERIMRIILDTRQQRKRLKRANRHHSTSVPVHNSLYGDNEHIESYNRSNMNQPIPMVQFTSYSRSHCNRDRLNWRNSGSSNANTDGFQKRSNAISNRPHGGPTRKSRSRKARLSSMRFSSSASRRKKIQPSTKWPSTTSLESCNESRYTEPELDYDDDNDESIHNEQLVDEESSDEGTETDHEGFKARQQHQLNRSSPLRATFYPSEWAKQDNIRLNGSLVDDRNDVVDLNIYQDISTVAWMIVLGDGLHNFIDGISIGAAFSESILSGVSISVAVICEEFPHELGDFAVLVSSGMTVRQALGYNFLSACTCYLGMAFGIILGDVDEGASYISALAAGVFLYIALVDMMGELSATLEKSSHGSIAKTLNLLLLQNVGIFIGISIIFVLSFIDF